MVGKAFLSMTPRAEILTRKMFRGFPGGTVVKNPPANAGDTGSSPGPGGSHMPRSNEAHAPQLLSLHATTTEPACLQPVLCSRRSHRNEKPMHCNEE